MFIIFSALFAVAAPLVIMYSQGYRIDLVYGTIVKTGGLFLEPRPAPMKIYLDRRFKTESNFLFQNIYIGLFPRLYFVEIKKDGYFSWEKRLKVFPKLVTEAKNIYLFPQNIMPKILAQNVKEFYPSQNNKYIAIAQENFPSRLKLYTIADTAERILYEDAATSTPYSVSEAVWNSGSSEIALVLTGIAGSKITVIDAVNPAAFSEVTFDKSHVSNISWSSLNQDEIILIASNNKYNLLLKYNKRTKGVTQPLAYDVLSYDILDKKIHYISFVTKSVSAIDIATGELSQITFSPIDSAPKHKLLTPDEKKFLIREDKKIFVHWLEDMHIQPFRDAGQKLKIVETDMPIFDAVWFTKNNEYIIFSSASGIYAVELDTRDKQNIYKIVAMPAQKLHYDSERNALYFLSDDTLYAADLK